jgi:transposase-like protein
VFVMPVPPRELTRAASRYAASGAIFFRAVNKTSQTVDFRFSRRREMAAAKAFLQQRNQVPGLLSAHDHSRWICRAIA